MLRRVISRDPTARPARSTAISFAVPIRRDGNPRPHGRFFLLFNPSPRNSDTLGRNARNGCGPTHEFYVRRKYNEIRLLISPMITFALMTDSREGFGRFARVKDIWSVNEKILLPKISLFFFFLLVLIHIFSNEFTIDFDIYIGGIINSRDSEKKSFVFFPCNNIRQKKLNYLCKKKRKNYCDIAKNEKNHQKVSRPRKLVPTGRSPRLQAGLRFFGSLLR